MINLKEREWRWWSQHGEDGVIRTINEVIPPQYKTFVEIGAHFHEANCLRLQQSEHWSGVYFDDFHEFHPLRFYKAWITAENINAYLSQIPFATSLDILSLDIDGNDFYVWNALQSKFYPRITIVEANCFFKADEDKVIVYDPSFRWDGSSWWGCSALAWCNLLRPRGYSLLYIESTGANMFFVKKELIPEDTFEHVDDLEFLLSQVTPPVYKLDTLNRSFITTEEAITLRRKADKILVSEI